MPPKKEKTEDEAVVSLGPEKKDGENVFAVARIFASFNDTFVHVTDLSGRETICRQVFFLLLVSIQIPVPVRDLSYLMDTYGSPHIMRWIRRGRGYRESKESEPRITFKKLSKIGLGMINPKSP